MLTKFESFDLSAVVNLTSSQALISELTNTKKIGVIETPTLYGDFELQDILDRFFSLSPEDQNNQIQHFEEKYQNCKMDKPFSYDIHEKNNRLLTPEDMKMEEINLKRSRENILNKQYSQFSNEEKQEFDNTLQSIINFNRESMKRCMILSQYYRQRVKDSIYEIFEKNLNNIDEFNKEKIEEITPIIMKDIQNILNTFQKKLFMLSL